MDMIMGRDWHDKRLGREVKRLKPYVRDLGLETLRSTLVGVSGAAAWLAVNGVVGSLHSVFYPGAWAIEGIGELIGHRPSWRTGNYWRQRPVVGDGDSDGSSTVGDGDSDGSSTVVDGANPKNSWKWNKIPLPFTIFVWAYDLAVKGINAKTSANWPRPRLRWNDVGSINTWKPTWDGPKLQKLEVAPEERRFDPDAEIDGTKLKTLRMIEAEAEYVTETQLTLAEKLRIAILTEKFPATDAQGNPHLRANQPMFPNAKKQLEPDGLPDHPAVVAAASAMQDPQFAQLRGIRLRAYAIEAARRIQPNPDAALTTAINKAIRNPIPVLTRTGILKAANFMVDPANAHLAQPIRGFAALQAVATEFGFMTNLPPNSPLINVMANAITNAVADSESIAKRAQAAINQRDRGMQRLMKVAEIYVNISNEVVNQVQKVQSASKVERDLMKKHLMYVLAFPTCEFNHYAHAGNNTGSRATAWAFDTDPQNNLRNAMF